MASGFSVCSLFDKWRAIIPPGGTEAQGIGVLDPKWYALKTVIP